MRWRFLPMRQRFMPLSPANVDKRGPGGIANTGITYYLVLSIYPSTESIPLKYHDLIRCISFLLK